MIQAVLVLIIVFWLLGLVQIPYIHTVLFRLVGHAVTLQDLLLFFLIMWALGILPSPFREIGIILFLLWILSTLGIIAIAGFSHLLILAIIIGIVIAIFRG
jgi:hypothetical protein